MSQIELLTDYEQRVAIEISRLWSGTDKRKDQRADMEVQLSLFSQTAAKYPSTVIQKAVTNWIEENRWWPSAVKDFDDALREAQMVDQLALPSCNDPWAKIRDSSPAAWSKHLVKLYEEQNRGLRLAVRLELERQAMNMVRDNGAGTFGVHPHPIWTAQDCLRRTRYA